VLEAIIIYSTKMIPKYILIGPGSDSFICIGSHLMSVCLSDAFDKRREREIGSKLPVATTETCVGLLDFFYR